MAALWLIIHLIKRRELIKEKVAGSIVTVFFLFLPIITKKNLSILNCFEIEQGEYWLIDDLDIRCWEDEH